jgi:hypothetical protein
MLRAAHLPRSQPTVLNLLLVSKRWQKTPASPGSGTTTSTKSTPGSSTIQYATSNPSSANPYKTTTTASTSSSRTGPPPTFSAPPTGNKSSGSSTAIKAIVYSVALGLTGTLVYAEYENGPFRRQLESTVPFTSTILGGLDKVIEPVFGNRKPITTQVAEKLPDLSYVKDKLPDKDQVKTVGQQIKKAGEQVKGAASQAADQV